MRRRYVLLLLLISAVFPLSARTTGYYHSAAATASGYLGFSHFEDEIPARTSFSGSAALGVFGYQSQHWDGSLELYFQDASRSLPYGLYRSRGFTSIGTAARSSYTMNNKFSLYGQAGTEVNFYHQIEKAFASFSLQLGGQLLLMENPSYQLFMTLPLSLHLRKEITALQVGIGLRYHLFPYHEGGT
ncbi:MAG: hypothetical protein GX836_07565 [Spirochaetales bacterium]|nr:hypothetical protein [Spirochaetales bacterium]